jgi:hypothetical protein
MRDVENTVGFVYQPKQLSFFPIRLINCDSSRQVQDGADVVFLYLKTSVYKWFTSYERVRESDVEAAV